MGRSTLIPQYPIIFTPDTAMLVGLNCAIIIQKLHFLLMLPDNGREVGGEKWIYNTYSDWREKYFPFWSEDTIERGFLALEKAALVSTIQPEGRVNRRKYYRVSEAGYAMLNTKNLPDHRNLPPSAPEDRNLPLSEDRNLPPSCASASNQTKNTQRILMSDGEKSPLYLDGEATEIYKAYPRKDSRADSIKAITKHLRKYGKEFLLTATLRYAEQHRKDEIELKFTPLAATWFNKQRFLDIMEDKPPEPSHDDIPEEAFVEESYDDQLQALRKLKEERGF